MGEEVSRGCSLALHASQHPICSPVVLSVRGFNVTKKGNVFVECKAIDVHGPKPLLYGQLPADWSLPDSVS